MPVNKKSKKVSNENVPHQIERLQAINDDQELGIATTEEAFEMLERENLIVALKSSISGCESVSSHLKIIRAISHQIDLNRSV